LAFLPLRLDLFDPFFDLDDPKRDFLLLLLGASSGHDLVPDSESLP